MEAAKKIQSVWRGWRDRKLVKSLYEALLDICKDVEREIRNEFEIGYKCSVRVEAGRRLPNVR